MATDIPLTGGVGSAQRSIYASVLPAQQGAATGAYLETISDPATNVVYALDVGQAPCLGLAGKRTTFGFSASARVDPNCVVSASDLNFGVLTDFSRPVDAQTSISVNCSAGLSYTIALDGGRSRASDPTQRKMTSGVASIRYALHRDAARSLPWGASSANAHASVGSGGAQTIPVYGRIAAGQRPSPGSYSDVIVITVAY